MAFSSFLKIDGLVGESTQAGHVGEIEIYSFSWGASNPTAPTGATGSGAGAGKVSISSFNLMKKADQVSPALFTACAKGSHYKGATVTMVKATGSGTTFPFLEYDFSDLVVQSIQWSGSSGGDDTPTESVSLAFAKVIYKNTAQAATGAAGSTTQAGWDLTANKPA